jgi:carbonic anhydrase/acetyltransferase-like protein (isoleucine patch superfamily)
LKPIKQIGINVAIYSFGDKVPNIHPSAFVHPEAVIIGDVSVGEMSFIGPCAVLRGDSSRIEIGARTSIQDGSVIHCTAELPTIVGDECTVGHNAHLEGCTVQSGALVGSGSLVLHKAVIESGALVAAGAVVLGGTLVPSGALAVGVPAKIKEGAADPETIAYSIKTYTENARRYPVEMKRIN